MTSKRRILNVKVGGSLHDAVERGPDGRVCVPWSDIVLDMKLPEQRAA